MNDSLRCVNGQLEMTLTPELWRQIKACIPAHEPEPFPADVSWFRWVTRQEIASSFDKLLEDNPDLQTFDKNHL